MKIEAYAKAEDKDLISETVTLKTATSPAKVSVKSVKKAGTGKIRISWKRVKGADGYEILVKAGDGMKITQTAELFSQNCGLCY